MFIEKWLHSDVTICDKYREQTALYVPVLLCTTFSQLSDFNHFIPMTERGSSYDEKYLTEDEMSAELLAETLSDVPEDTDSDSEKKKWNSVHLQALLSATPQREMFTEVSHPPALLGSLVSISWKFQYTKIVSEFVINF